MEGHRRDRNSKLLDAQFEKIAGDANSANVRLSKIVENDDTSSFGGFDKVVNALDY